MIRRLRRSPSLPRRSVPGVHAPAPTRIVTLLALLTAVGPISTDMYLPAFPAMRASLHGSAGDVQTTLAAWFLGLAVGQVTHGPIADHHGRRMPLLIGTFVYTVASIGCALAWSMDALSAWRFVAAFGGAASLVIPRAIIRDLAVDGTSAAQLLGRLILVTGIVPMLAPTLGGFIEMRAGWRAIFWVAAVYGVLCLGLIWWLLPDTLASHFHRRLRPLPILMRYGRVWKDRCFRMHALQGGFATFTLFAFLGGAPPVFLGRFHFSPTAFGALFVLNAGGYILGAQANARLVARYCGDNVLTASTWGLLGVTLVLLALALTGHADAFAVAALFVLVMATLGLVLPGAALGSILGHAREAGSASALYGTAVFFIGALATVAVGRLGDTTPLPMCWMMALGAAAAVATDLRRPRSRPARAAAA